jgi:hypothetical protein
MYKERKEDLSVLRFIKEIFSDVPFVVVVDEFPLEEIKTPTIAVTKGQINYSWFEIGDKEMLESRTWYFDVFAVDKNQRDEYAYRISDKLRNDVIQIYDYGVDLVSPPSLDYCLQCVDLRIEFLPSFVEGQIGATHRAMITATFEPTKII